MLTGGTGTLFYSFVGIKDHTELCQGCAEGVKLTTDISSFEFLISIINNYQGNVYELCSSFYCIYTVTITITKNCTKNVFSCENVISHFLFII